MMFDSIDIFSGLTITWVRSWLRIYQCFDSPILFSSLYGPGITSAMYNLYFLKILVQRDEGGELYMLPEDIVIILEVVSDIQIS